jgi:type IV secretory pathway VirB2 component (pilin)
MPSEASPVEHCFLLLPSLKRGIGPLFQPEEKFPFLRLHTAVPSLQTSQRGVPLTDTQMKGAHAHTHSYETLRTHWRRWLTPSLLFLTALPVYAQASSDPWDNAVNVLKTAFTGTIATVLSLVAIVVGGLMFAYGEGQSKKTLAGIVFGVGADIRSAQKVHAACLANSIPVRCGGMLESGIGRAHHIAVSTLPGDVSASQRYWEQDIIEPEVEVSSRGTIQVPQSPELGTPSGAVSWRS